MPISECRMEENGVGIHVVLLLFDRHREGEAYQSKGPGGRIHWRPIHDWAHFTSAGLSPNPNRNPNPNLNPLMLKPCRVDY
ncbi:MAG: hypothetical protein V2A34_15300, partial [Lentisphaerota bacterium]